MAIVKSYWVCSADNPSCEQYTNFLLFKTGLYISTGIDTPFIIDYANINEYTNDLMYCYNNKCNKLLNIKTVNDEQIHVYCTDRTIEVNVDDTESNIYLHEELTDIFSTLSLILNDWKKSQGT